VFGSTSCTVPSISMNASLAINTPFAQLREALKTKSPVSRAFSASARER
jgi:hypothetical protein